MLVAGTPYAATYYNVSGEWILRGLTGAPGIPLGVALPYFGVTAPGSAFALPFGQAISRTTYVNLFNLVAFMAPATVRPRSTFPTCAAICSPARTTWAARPRAASPPAPRASTAPCSAPPAARRP
jgi:hypothetical protein